VAGAVVVLAGACATPAEDPAESGSGPTAVTPEAATPEAATPEAATPEAVTPEAVTPEAAAAAAMAARLNDVSNVAANDGNAAATADVELPDVLATHERLDVAGLPSQAPDARPSLEAWTTVGDADWSADGRLIDGKVGGGAQSFLVSRGVFGDFDFQVELRNLEPGNSGIQVRSHVVGGRLRGYQIEIDPSPRAWSGGLYDEGRRGWLDDLSDDEAARAAFRPGEWNRYRIVCEGPWIRAWVNGVPTADQLDPLDAWGRLALQVHSGNNTHVQWRDLALIDHGVRPWEAIDLDLGEHPGVMLPYAARDTWLRLDEDATDGAWRAVVRGRGPLLVALRSPRLPRPLAIPAGTGPALWAERHAVFGRVELSMEPQVVSLSLAGGRAALHVDGKSVASLVLPEETPASGAVSLAATREGLLVSAARLGDPVLRR
jgi:hypothetical protein